MSSPSESAPKDVTPKDVTLKDVTLRDGLQSLPNVLSTKDKIAVYDLLVRAGIQEAQVTSFVSPKRVPQLADADELWLALQGKPGRRDALIANYRGFERALELRVKRLEMVLAVSPSYQQKNSNRSQEDTFEEIVRIVPEARREGIHLAVSLSNAWHCSFEGPTDWERLEAWLLRMRDLGVSEVVLADTTGVAQPGEVAERVAAAKAQLPETFLRVHLHALTDRGDDVEKASAAIEAGANGLDAGLLGLGGSPFAGQVGGNIDLVKLVEAGLFGADLSLLRDAQSLLSALISEAPANRPG